MKTRIHCLLSLLLAACATGAHAQSIWTYEVIGADGKTTSSRIPHMDISYPKNGAPASVVDAREKQRWVPINAREEAERMSAPKLIIMLGAGVP